MIQWLRQTFEKLAPLRHWAYVYLPVILAATFFRRFVLAGNDPYKCNALLNQGQWYHGNTWLTPGCVTDHYSGNSISECAFGRSIAFFGDAQLVGTYWALVHKLDKGIVEQEPVEGRLHYSNNFVTVEFFLDPRLDGPELFSSVQAYYNGSSTSPTILVVGAGSWHVNNDKISDYVEAVDKIISAGESSNNHCGLRSGALTATDGPGNLLLFAPVQEPYSDQNENSDKIEAYRSVNAHLEDLANENAINLLRSFDLMTRNQKDKYNSDGIQVRSEVSERRADVLLGLRCNAKAARTHSFPNTRTCCGIWAGPNWIQAGFLITSLILLPTLILLDRKLQIFESDGLQVVWALFVFTATISLQYITDRTHIFEQVQRLGLVTANLRNMLIVAALIGVVTVRRSKPPKKQIPGEGVPDQPFLPRDQSDEWKGWMQLLIIIYHYQMGWTADWLWEIIRLCVSSYLFLTGFGHTVYFLQKKDYSLRRFAAVMIRTNLLPCTLAFVMRTRWLLYYYMPLSTFWFVVLYATLATYKTYNNYKIFVIGKIILFAAIVNSFLETRDLPETIVKFFVITCKISFNTGDFFHYRVKIDQYIVFVGMLVAMLYIWVVDALNAEAPRTAASRMFRANFQWIKYISIAGAGIGLASFWYYIHLRVRSQGEWRHEQPYMTFIPILAFLVLRNAHPSLRNFHSVAFAWLGRYSGEMYVMQDHIWLAGDQEAILRTGFFHGDETVPGDRWRDLVLITPLYFIACWLIGDATASITTWFIKDSPPRVEICQSSTLPTERSVSAVEMGLLNDMDENASSGKEQVIDEPELPPPARQRLLVTLRNTMSLLRPRKLRTRLILVLGAMWFMNMTYG